MSTPMQRAIIKIINANLPATSVNRTTAAAQQAEGPVGATGQIIAFDAERKSATVLKPDGTTEEFFMQNRWVLSGDHVGAIGSRVL